MSTIRIALAALALAAGGFLVGWSFLPHGDGPDPPDRPPASSLVEASHRFALTALDERADRERPAIAVDVRGRALLAWASQTAEATYTLFLARSDDGGDTFGPPIAFRTMPVRRYTSMMRGKEVTRTMTPLPRLAGAGETIALGWLEPLAGQNVALRLARSRDGGRSFDEPVDVQGEAASRPNFTGLGLGPDGSAVAVWLDHRNKSQQPFAAVLTSGGKVIVEQIVYPGADGHGICPCCDVEALRGPDGTTFVAFRDAEGGYRDIVVSRAAPGSPGFEAPVPVSDYHWKFDGCPHDGPSLALTSGRLLVAWMDARSGRSRVHVARADSGGTQFSTRALNPDGTADQIQPRIAADGDIVHAVWSEGPPASNAVEKGSGHQHGWPAGSVRSIVYAGSSDGGESFAAPVALAPADSAYQTRPVVAVGPKGPLVAWMESTDRGKSVVCVRLKPATTGSCGE